MAGLVKRDYGVAVRQSNMKGHVASDLTLAFCLRKPPKWFSISTFDAPGKVAKTICFEETAFFGRWLFAQPRGADVPQAILIVGWTEVKPCVQAIVAALTGDSANLRPDKMRPELPKWIHGKGKRRCAIRSVILLVDPPWKEEGLRVTEMFGDYIPTDVVASMDELYTAMAAAKCGVWPCRSPLAPAPGTTSTPPLMPQTITPPKNPALHKMLAKHSLAGSAAAAAPQQHPGPAAQTLAGKQPLARAQRLPQKNGAALHDILSRHLAEFAREKPSAMSQQMDTVDYKTMSDLVNALALHYATLHQPGADRPQTRVGYILHV